jgi:poly [ADP-ribose] polymerase
LKKELELLESLSDMRIAEEIMKDSKKKSAGNVHPLDIQFAALKLEEMTPLSERTKEFKEIKSYLCNTVGSTHAHIKYTVEDIFRIKREGEFDRFNTSAHSKIENSNRRLLWHGSRSTNFGGILSEGVLYTIDLLLQYANASYSCESLHRVLQSVDTCSAKVCILPT